MSTAKGPKPGAIDWQEAHRRLDRLRAAADEALRLPPARARAVLEERARALARVPARAAGRGEVLEVVTFSLGDERYGVETRHVREVVRCTGLTPVPGAPDFLAGLSNLRGEILAVLDLRQFFGVAGRGLTDLTRILVLGGERAEFGVLADAAHAVVALPARDLHEPPESVAGVGREYLRGVTAEALIVLDGAVLLQDARLFIDQGDEAAG